jgi:hypothetical protein
MDETIDFKEFINRFYELWKSNNMTQIKDEYLTKDSIIKYLNKKYKGNDFIDKLSDIRQYGVQFFHIEQYGFEISTERKQHTILILGRIHINDKLHSFSQNFKISYSKFDKWSIRESILIISHFQLT